MKNIVIFLMSCLAFVQSYAATSPLTESLLEYDTIIDTLATDSNFRSVFSENEFIVDIVRKTKRLDVTGTVKYFIETCTINSENKCRRSRTYLVTLEVTLNPGVGPNIVTFVSIERWNTNGKNRNLRTHKEPQRAETLPGHGAHHSPATSQHVTSHFHPTAPIEHHQPQDQEEETGLVFDRHEDLHTLLLDDEP